MPAFFLRYGSLLPGRIIDGGGVDFAIQMLVPVVGFCLIVRQPKPAFLIADGHVFLREVVAALGRTLIPVNRLFLIERHLQTAVIHQSQIELRVCIPLLRQFMPLGVGDFVVAAACG